MTLKQDIINNISHESSDLYRIAHIEDQVFKYRGCARQVYGGWVWVVDGNEQRWSKRPTHAQCIETVYEVVERLGEEDAFDLYVGSED